MALATRPRKYTLYILHTINGQFSQHKANRILTHSKWTRKYCSTSLEHTQTHRHLQSEEFFRLSLSYPLQQLPCPFLVLYALLILLFQMHSTKRLVVFFSVFFSFSFYVCPFVLFSAGFIADKNVLAFFARSI